MLLERQNECEVLDQLLASARQSKGGAILVHGDPGIGKTAVLEYAVGEAQGFKTLRTVCSEAEMGLPFAGLQQLCSPALAGLDQLPDPQRKALRVAFGLVTGSAPDRLLIGLAVLTLLSELTEEAPLLCVVDDSQWLDAESEQALGFVARRLATERIAFIFGARGLQSEFQGLPDLPLGGLSDIAARALLRSVIPDRVDEHVLDRILAEAHGNPLALLELPRGLTPAQLAGGFTLPVSLPLAGRIEASIRRQLSKLPKESREWLVVAAAEPTGDPALVFRAAEYIGIDDSAATTAETDGLLELTPRVVFRHPLVRSAIYGAASPDERRRAHRALAEVTDPTVDPDRRAWHRAQAASKPDDDVASELEFRAGRAQARGGFAASAAFMERSAELTTDKSQRASRALVAAEAQYQAGALDAVLRLATIAEREPLDQRELAELDVLRGQVAFATNQGSDAPRLLVQAAHRIESQDPDRACQIYLDAITAALFAGRLSRGWSARDVAEAALKLKRAVGKARASDALLHGLAVLIARGPSRGTAELRDALTVFCGPEVGPEERLRWSWLAGRAAAYIWDYDTWDLLTAQQIQLANETGALTVLPLTLGTRAGVSLFAGDVSKAAALVDQVEALGYRLSAPGACNAAAVSVASLRGRNPDARELIDRGAKEFASRGEGMSITLTQWAGSLLYNGLARYDDAYHFATQALEDPHELWFSPWATVELIEAASRSGRSEVAAAALERLAEGTTASGTAWASAVEARSRALLSDGKAAEELYLEAVELLTPTALRLDLARTRLLYGEWLRRDRRHLDARHQLREAHTLFSEFGMEGFADRAQLELRATGEEPRHKAESLNELTAQEEQVSRLVSQGATNREIAAQLFISPSTVEYHLNKVFRKLGVKSRTQLARHMHEMSA